MSRGKERQSCVIAEVGRHQDGCLSGVLTYDIIVSPLLFFKPCLAVGLWSDHLQRGLCELNTAVTRLGHTCAGVLLVVSLVIADVAISPARATPLDCEVETNAKSLAELKILGREVNRSVNSEFSRLIETGAFNDGRIEASATKAFTPFIHPGMPYCRATDILAAAGFAISRVVNMHIGYYDVTESVKKQTDTWFFHNYFYVELSLRAEQTNSTNDIVSYSAKIATFGL